ncbi:hypothetical protein BU15DRAFT_65775 [Melanogaster broomeanus]|nr:hypothetical protein BU15DRAFT_65775 [Melanogaster broomeanus]
MAYSTVLDDGSRIQVPELANDGRNWKTYRENVLRVAKHKNLLQQFDGIDAKPVNATERELAAWDQRNCSAQFIITSTIPDSLILRIMHLETAHEYLDYFTDLFKRESEIVSWMAMHSPRTPAVTRQKPSERSHKTRDCETAAKKSKSAEVEESRNRTRHEPERDTSSQGRVERRDRRGKRAAGWKGEHRAAARGPGEEATDETSSSISLASMPSSQTTPPKPETTRQAASEAAADAVNPNATSAGPTGPAGASGRQREGQGQEANEGVEGEGETSTGRTGEEITAAKAPGEGTADQTADGVSLAAPASSPNDDGGDEDVHHTHVAPNETPPTASKQHRTKGRRTSRDRAERAKEWQAETPMHETAAPLSMPLEGERNSQVTSDNTGAHCSKGAERPDNTADAQDSTQTQRCTNGTHAGQRHGASAHGEGRCARAEQPCSAHERDSCVTSSSAQVPDGIAEDPGGRVKPSTHPDRPPSTSLEGERGHEPSSSRADDGTIVRAHEAQLEVQRGHLEAEEDRHTPEHALEGERGGWRSIGHAREEVRSQSGTKPAHNEDDAAAAAAAQPVSRRSGCVHMPHNANDTGDMHRGPQQAQCKGEQPQMVQIEQEDDGTPPVKQRRKDKPQHEHTRQRGHAPHDPGGGVHKRNQSSEVKGETGDRSEGKGSGRDDGASSNDGATSGTGRRLETSRSRTASCRRPSQHKNGERIRGRYTGPPNRLPANKNPRDLPHVVEGDSRRTRESVKHARTERKPHPKYSRDPTGDVGKVYTGYQGQQAKTEAAAHEDRRPIAETRDAP